MSLVLFSMLAYLRAIDAHDEHVGAPKCVQGIYRAHLSQRLVGLNKAMALPVVAIAYAMDVAANWIIAPLVFSRLAARGIGYGAAD